eukprot:TRINITY_DN4433_c0_g1_i1.p1 TRINITY_DN4433_c0_g1~~TRINITY_DN4433_c0_g1_i1.p1  ORF type:complete len:471 (+),score=57.28 TRINITY_DN4433_c0_g1_i1:158-1570(+)
MMRIAVHSNLISGLYFIIFETLLPLFLSFALQKLISAYNLHTIYNRKQPLHLTKTRLSIVCTYGISSAKHARLASILGSLVLLLCILGSFSIDGRSRRATTLNNAQYFITAASGDDEMIDFAQHISANGTMVSAAYIMARAASNCRVQNVGTRIMFSAVGSYDGDINLISHARSSLPSNLTCAYEQNGFRNGATFVQEHTSQERRFGRDCQLFNEYSETIANDSSLALARKRRNGTIWEARAHIRCSKGDAEVMQTWCASFENLLCLSQVRLDGRFFVMFQVFESAIAFPRAVIIAPRYTEQAERSRTMQSAVFLMARSLNPDVAGALGLSRVSIKRNTKVEMDAGEVLETEIIVWLIIVTAGLATVLTLSVCILALIRWRQYVVQHGLKEKNSLSGAMGIMSLAAEVVGDDHGEGLISDGVIVGVNGNERRVGPFAKEKIGGGEFDENCVEGRCRQRMRSVLRVEPMSV